MPNAGKYANNVIKARENTPIAKPKFKKHFLIA